MNPWLQKHIDSNFRDFEGLLATGSVSLVIETNYSATVSNTLDAGPGSLRAAIPVALVAVYLAYSRGGLAVLGAGCRQQAA